MNGLTIMMVLHNEAEYAKLSLQSIRRYADVDNLSVVLVDNHSEDGLSEWARAQEDITYVYMDEGMLPFGQAVNQVCQALSPEDDLLLMDAHYRLTPHALSRLQDTLYQDDKIGAVGGKSNSFLFYQKEEETDSYEAAVDQAGKECAVTGKQVLSLHYGAVLFRSSALSALGNLEEALPSQEYVLADTCFRLIINHWKLYFCPEAIFWDMRGSGPYHAKNQSEFELLKQKWGMHYFQTMYNENILQMITADKNAPVSVLEIGCDCGATLLEIHNRNPNAVVCGCEINKHSANIASHIADVQICNIEEQALTFTPHTFDYIIFGDVLEHLHDPLKTIRYCRKFLKAGGCIVASIPNLMHISVMEKLLQGDFTYTETGLLDKTHIHLFTYNEILTMFQEGGYKISQIKALTTTLSASQEALLHRLLALQCGASEFMYQAFWYIVRAQC